MVHKTLTVSGGFELFFQEDELSEFYADILYRESRPRVALIVCAFKVEKGWVEEGGKDMGRWNVELCSPKVGIRPPPQKNLVQEM